MKLENYTNVKLKNGKEGAIVEVFENAYFVDVSDDILTVQDKDIAEYYKDGAWHKMK